jgi:hypothetical protein
MRSSACLRAEVTTEMLLWLAVVWLRFKLVMQAVGM